jgi:predicted CoA-binding protein
MMNDTELKEMLSAAKNIAVVGLSNSPMRASFGVSRFLQRQGYRVIPVNPKETEVLGERCYPTLDEVPDSVDIVNIFRRSEFVPEVVEAAVARHASRTDVRCIWMQERVVNSQAAARAEDAGIPVIMDRCILKELARLFS